MYLPILIIKLAFPFLLYQRVNSFGQSFIQNQILSKNDIDEDLVKNFLVELIIKPCIKKSEFRQIMIITRETNDLLKVQPLLEIYPYIICQNNIGCNKSLWLSQRSLVINFISNLNNSMIKSEIKILSSYLRCKFLFISNGTIRFDDLSMIFTISMKRGLAYVKVAQVVENTIQLYTDDISKNCSMGVKLIAVYKLGNHLPNVNIDNWNSKVRDLNGCMISVMTSDNKPDMMIKNNDNGSSSIVGGREGLLVLTLADKLNFNIDVINLMKRQEHNGEINIVRDARRRIEAIGIGNLPQLKFFAQRFAFSYPYAEDCITWAVPRRTIRPNDIVWVEFNWEVWLFVGLTFVISCVIGWAMNLRMNSMIKGEINTRHQGFVEIIFDAVAIHLGIPVVNVSSSPSIRFMLLSYLYYSIVITTAYKSSLAASLTDINRVRSAIVDVKGIFNENITVRVLHSDYSVYLLQSDHGRNFVLPKERFVFYKTKSEDIDLFSVNDNKGYLGSLTWINYKLQARIKSRKYINFNILDGCQMNYKLSLYMQKGSRLENSINEIIQQLLEGGILDHWNIGKLNFKKILIRQSLEDYYKNRASDKFRDIFIFYYGCIAFCLITFFIELITVKIQSYNN